MWEGRIRVELGTKRVGGVSDSRSGEGFGSAGNDRGPRDIGVYGTLGSGNGDIESKSGDWRS